MLLSPPSNPHLLTTPASPLTIPLDAAPSPASDASMTAFTFPSPAVNSYGSSPSAGLDLYTKSIDPTSDRIGELQKFLLGSDWSSLSSLSPPSASARAVVEDTLSWPSTEMTDAPLFPSSADTLRPAAEPTAAVQPVDNVSETGAVTQSPAPTISTVAAPAAYDSSVTPLHRQSFEACYSDSVGSPDSERDFLTSPSMFDDADFEFDADSLANNFPLFGDSTFEDVSDSHAEDPMTTFASNLENVKLESEDHDSQSSDVDLAASQSTVMPSYSQVKSEHDSHDSMSTLEAAFKVESDADGSAAKREQPYDMWSADELKPYFSDEDIKAAELSTLANAFGAEPLKLPLALEFDVDAAKDDEKHDSHAGPIRSSRGSRDQRRASPVKALGGASASTSASPAPIIDPVTKAKRWQCHECGKWFDRAYNLKTHRYTHEDPETRARPFICPDAECHKHFARKHDMQRHFENVHRGESRRSKGASTKRSRAGDLG